MLTAKRYQMNNGPRSTGGGKAQSPVLGSSELSSSEQKAGLNATPVSSAAMSQLISSVLASQSKRTEDAAAAAQAGPGEASPLKRQSQETTTDESSPNTKRARLSSAETPIRAPATHTTVSDVLRSLTTGQQVNQVASSANLISGDVALRLRSELSAQAVRAQLTRNEGASNAGALSMMNLHNLNLGALLHSAQPGSSSSSSGLALRSALLHDQQSQQLAFLRQLVGLQALQRSHRNLTYATGSNVLAPQIAQRAPEGADLALLMQQLTSQNNTQGRASIDDLLRHRSQASAGTAASSSAANVQPAISASSLRQNAPDLPLCVEGQIEPYFKRPLFPLGVDEDPNWLSEFHCFVRSELVEVFRASHEDVKSRNNSIVHHQVGLRCRFCGHMTQNARAGRSSAFPSSLRQIYQSFTMMLRDHFGSCDAIPAAVKEKFAALKVKPAQGATDSKRFWVYSAMKIGMADSPEGIVITERTRANCASIPPFGTSPEQTWADDAYASVPLALQGDRSLVSEFLFTVMSQVQIVRLTDSERIGNRRSLKLGLPGIGCRYCCEHRRLGLCRVFPARRRTLPSKINDVYDHLRRCNLCPASVKEQLERTKHQMNNGFSADQGSDKEFFDRIWSRLGHRTSSPSESG